MKKLYASFKSVSDETPQWLVLLSAGLLGGFFFIILYGIDIINVENDSWLINSASDLSQHYFGWVFFRKTPWQFPVGLVKGLVSPDYVSVVYMDAVPLFAFVFKLFSPFLPDTFQYFGIYGLLTFVLQAIIGCKLIISRTGDNLSGISGTLFFISSSVLVQRMFLHSALAFHPIILLCIYLFFNREDIKHNRKDLPGWISLLVLSVLIHAYFFPIVMAFMLAFYLSDLFSKGWYNAILKIAAAVLLTLCVMYLAGYFYGGNNYSDAGFGSFNADLLALTDSQNTSRIAALFECSSAISCEEGYSYLGAGIIVLAIIACASEISVNGIKLRARTVPAFLLILVFTFFATYPQIKCDNRLLFDIAIPEKLLKICSIFRANGRFIWPVFYMVMAWSIIIVSKNIRYKGVVIFLCLLIQLFDLSDYYCRHQEKIENYCRSEFLLDDPAWDTLKTKSDLFFMYDPTEGNLNDIMALGWFAGDNGMEMNDFYISRKDADKISQFRENMTEQIINGNINSDSIYVFSSYPVSLRNSGLRFYLLDGILIGTADILDVPQYYPEIVWGMPVVFTSEGYNAGEYIIKGISGPEEWGSWTDGDEAEMIFWNDVPKGPVECTIDVSCSFYQPQNVDVSVNGERCYSGIVDGNQDIEFEFNNSDEKFIVLTLLLPDSIQPSQVIESNDRRDLGIGIKTISFS